MNFDQVRNRAVSEAIQNQKAALAARMVDLHFVRTPGLRESLGAEGVGKSIRDAEHNLQFLSEAIATGDPGGFGVYLVWLDKVLAGAGLKPSVLDEHLDCLRAVLSAELDEEARVVALDVLAPAQGALAVSRRGARP